MAAPFTDPTQLYQKMVGKLIFLTDTRPDTSFAVSTVSRFMCKPQEPHLQIVKHVYRYLGGSTDSALLFKRGEGDYLSGFTDAD